MPEQRELYLTLDFSLRVGELLLSSGAGAADVTASMEATARGLGVRSPDIDVTFTQLSMSYQPRPDERPTVLIRKVKEREIDYAHLTDVDHLVRDVQAGRVDLKEARHRLARIISTGHRLPRWAVTLGWGVMCAGVGVMLGGGVAVVVIAFVTAICIDLLQVELSRRKVPQFYRQVAGGGVATLIALAAEASPLQLDPSLVVTANIIMLLAGIAFLGALQDALSGFYVTGSARMTEGLLATAGIIGGVSGGLALASVLGSEIGRLEPGATTFRDVPVVATGGAIAAAAFAFASYAPRRALLPVGVVAAAAMVISQSVALGGFGRTWAAALAAFFVGLVSYTVAGRLRVPPLVVVVPAIVPMLPGLSIYRALSLLGEGGVHTSEGLLAMVTAASVAIALASGVILGEYVAQPLRRQGGPRLIGPLRPSRQRRRPPAG